jgi:hypothetical protein
MADWNKLIHNLDVALTNVNRLLKSTTNEMKHLTKADRNKIDTKLKELDIQHLTWCYERDYFHGANDNNDLQK